MEVKASAMILKAFQTCAFALFRAKFVQTKAHLQQLFNSAVLVAGLHPTSSSSRSLSLTGTLRSRKLFSTLCVKRQKWLILHMTDN